MIKRRKTKVVRIAHVKIGGDNPIAVQSMVKVPTKDYRSAITQIKGLEEVGCQIVRVSVRDEEDAHAIERIKTGIQIPLVADIHFNWRLAICAIRSGADKIRLNPGNIYKKEEIKEIVKAAGDYGLSIRVGLNSGSIPKVFKYNSKLKPSEKLIKAALDYIGMLEGLKFKDIVVSLKCSSVMDTIEAYEKFSKLSDHPLHLGLTATGFSEFGKIKSAVCLGSLLASGIGDTIRVSLTDRPQEEVKVAKNILSSLGLGGISGVEIISCPTCGRCEVDLIKIANDFQERISSASLKQPGVKLRPIKVAIMGCVVNGPGESEEADLGVAFGKGYGLLYKNSKPIKKVSSSQAVNELITQWSKLCTKT